MATVKTAKIKKFGVLPVEVEVEYLKPVRGRLFGAIAWLFLIRFKRFKLMLGEEQIGSFYRLIVPRYTRG